MVEIFTIGGGEYIVNVLNAVRLQSFSALSRCRNLGRPIHGPLSMKQNNQIAGMTACRYWCYLKNQRISLLPSAIGSRIICRSGATRSGFCFRVLVH